MIRVYCPAKLNLFLSVGPRDGRGYHPIRTIFQAVSLFDTLDIDLAPKATPITCNWAGLPAENTVFKALRLLSDIAQVPPLHIHLTKAIPAQSGLGGGSSDAAGLIRAISRFLPAPIADHHLFDVAVAVGMDVPFFLTGGRAIGEGYGEKLTPLDDTSTQWYVVLRPEVGVSTQEAYSKLDAKAREWKELPEHSNALYNDFERVMPCDCEDWTDRLLAHGASGALLSGSGSAVFGLFVSESSAQVAASSLRREWIASYGPRDEIPVWVTRCLTRADSLRVETL